MNESAIKSNRSKLIILLVAVPASFWLGAELFRAILDAARTSGYAGLLYDGVVQHKIGELLVMFPVLVIMLSAGKHTPERLSHFVGRLAPMMWAGGLLNGLAWLTLRREVDWHSWCLLLLVAGLSAPTLLRRWIEHADSPHTHSAKDAVALGVVFGVALGFSLSIAFRHTALAVVAGLLGGAAVAVLRLKSRAR